MVLQLFSTLMLMWNLSAKGKRSKSNASTLIYGRITYQLMESYWPSVVKNPTGNKPSDEFAVLIDNISKILFSRTLKNVDWKNTELKKEVIKEEILELKQQEGAAILLGSPSL